MKYFSLFFSNPLKYQILVVYLLYQRKELFKTTKNLIMATQITTAETFGIINYEQGLKRSPSQSKELVNMLKDRQIGQTPKNEASSLDLMDAWSRGYDKAHRIAMKAKFGF